jgi:hypothetical protein
MPTDTAQPETAAQPDPPVRHDRDVKFCEWLFCVFEANPARRFGQSNWTRLINRRDIQTRRQFLESNRTEVLMDAADDFNAYLPHTKKWARDLYAKYGKE